MLDKLKELLQNIEESEVYKEYKKEQPEGYLASASTMQKGDWQADFYSKKTQKLASFKEFNLEIIKTEDELFQKEKQDPEELNLKKAKIGLTNALTKVNLTLKEKHPGNPAQKYIIILQMLDGKLTWNITILTETFKVINIKIDGTSGKILKDSEENLLKL